MHWSDCIAKKIIAKNKGIDLLNIASGITPSGKIHVGNLREILTVEFTRCSLNKLGVSTRFIFFWDDYDPLRKVPENLQEKNIIKEKLGKPLTSVEDFCGKHLNYARHFGEEIEKILPCLGVNPEYVSQSKMYKDGVYIKEILFCATKIPDIKKILNRYRQVLLDDEWSPISIYCPSCETTNMLKVSKNNDFSYHCNSCGDDTELYELDGKNAKLTWRVDWPMRWNKYNIHFEPGGKDHSSDGGSRKTGEIICSEIFKSEPPVYLEYDFIGIKGRSGKMSSSGGDSIGIDELLKVYEPEVIRYLFASYKNNVEFTIGLDLDVIRIYEEYDRAERIYFGVEKSSEKREEFIRRSYELSQICKIEESLTQKVSFRHLCNVIQIFEFSLERILIFLEKSSGHRYDQKEIKSIELRFERASYWIRMYAPDSFVFRVRTDDISILEIPQNFLDFFHKFFTQMKEIKDSDEKEKNLEFYFYKIIEEEKLDVAEVCKVFYKLLISKERGPKLIQFLNTIGIDNILNRSRFLDLLPK